MNKKQASVVLTLILYIIIGIVAAAILFFIGTGKKKNSAFSPAAIEAAEKEHIIVESSEPEPAIPAQPEAVSYYKATTTNRLSFLHVRIAPGLTSDIIAKLPPATVAYVLEKGEEWSKIKTDTAEGYCYNKYLSFEQISKEEFPYQ